MPTDNVYIKGQTVWAQVDKPNQWDAWSLSLRPDAAGLEKIRDMQAKGLKNVLKKDDDGYFVAFRRPTKAVMRGKVVVFPPPIVVGPDGTTPLNTGIGNGSKVTVKLEVYTHGTPAGGKAIAARLAGVQVHELVPSSAGETPDTDEPLF